MPDVESPPLHPHQHAALVAELRRPQHAGRGADDVFAELSTTGGIKRLGQMRFLTQAQWDALPVKRRPADFTLISDADAAAFPTGVPGFPNKLRRAWFDRAWAEARG